MDDELKDIWKENLKDSLKNLSGFIKWLLVLNLTIALTYVVQYLQLKKQKEDVKKYNLVVKLPWQILETYYSNISADSISYYATNKIFPILQLGQYDILGYTAMMDPIAKATAQEMTDAKHNIGELQFAFNAIEKYSSALTEIASVKRDAVHFENLDQQHLSALIHIWGFDSIATTKRFKNALTLIIKDCEGYYNKTDSIKFLMIYASPDKGVTIPPSSPKVLKKLSFAFSRPDKSFSTFNQQSVQVLSDFQTFFKQNLPDSLRKIQNSLDSNTFESLGTVKSKEVVTLNKIEDFESGSSIAIPLTNINISLIYFVTIAGIINLFIIVYFLVQCKKVSGIWTNCCKLTDHGSDNISGYFYNWTYGVNNVAWFIFLFAGCLSFCSLISLLFSILLYPISDHLLTVFYYCIIVLFALVNFILGRIASKKYFELSKYPKKTNSEAD